MGTIAEDLPKCYVALKQIEENITQLKDAGGYFRRKRVAYRKILKGKHHFDLEAMEREIDDCGDEIEKVEKTIDDELARKSQMQFVIRTLEDKDAHSREPVHSGSAEAD